MESSSTLLTNLNQRKSPSSPMNKPMKHKRKTNNKPIKVRYISNPMKVETCASKFRELVQELTGQDAVDLPPQPTTFAAAVEVHHPTEVNPTPVDEGICSEYYSPLDHDEEVLPQQMSAGLNGFFTSGGFYNVNALGSIGSL